MTPSRTPKAFPHHARLQWVTTPPIQHDMISLIFFSSPFFKKSILSWIKKYKSEIPSRLNDISVDAIILKQGTPPFIKKISTYSLYEKTKNKKSANSVVEFADFFRLILILDCNTGHACFYKKLLKIIDFLFAWRRKLYHHSCLNFLCHYFTNLSATIVICGLT